MILYIAKRGEHDIGTYTHLSVLEKIYGEENIFQVDLLKTQVVRKDRYISYGYNGNKIIPRVIRYFEGNCNFINNNIIRDILKIIQKYKISMVFTEESDLGKLYKRIKETSPEIPIICFFHDISAELFKIRIKDAAPWKIHYKLECKRVIEQEKMTVKYVDEKWVFHDADALRYKNYYGEEPTAKMQIAAPKNCCIDDSYRENVGVSGSKKKILFVCSKYYVNIKGFKWFYLNVFPYLNDNFEITVVGTGAPEVRDFVDDSKVNIQGMVDSMTPYYKEADIVIEPVFDGGGMKVKTLEALSFGKIIISTQESLNGYWEKTPDSVKGKYVFLCNTIEDWICICNKLISTDICKFNNAVYELFENEFSEDTLYENMKNAFSNVMVRKQ